MINNLPNKRQFNIESLRIVGCFIVICLHTSSWYISGDSILKKELFLKCFLQDGVPIFWYIMGFFLFSKEQKFSELFIKTIKKVFFPALFVMIVFQIIGPWLMTEKNNISLFECIINPKIDSKNLFGNILQWKSSMTLGGHLWYIFSYIKVILWYPLISLICRNDKHSNYIRRYLLILSVLYVLINDVQQFMTLSIGKIIPFSILDNSLSYVLIGYEISCYKKTLDVLKIRFAVYFLFSFISLNMIRFIACYILLRSDLSNDYFLHINNLVSYLSSISIFVSLYIIFNQIANNTIKSILFFISKYTFGIYLIHRGVYEKLNKIGLRNDIYSSSSNSNIMLKLFCLFVYAAIVFCGSFIICIIWKWLMMKIKKPISRVRQGF